MSTAPTTPTTDLSFAAAGGPTRLVPMWRGWISGFGAGAAIMGLIWSFFA